MKNERKIIFIGGVHGVGKGTICKIITMQLPLEHLVASELIKWSEISSNSHIKNIDNINATQDKLLIALNNKGIDSKNYLLDGHFCLINNDNRPIEVPINTFKSINPVLLLLLVDSPKSIKEKLEKRDGVSYNIEFIDNLQKREIIYAKKVSNELNCELIIFTTEEYKNVIKKLKLIL
ncbi:ATP-binding protein [Plebeiibacterium sediminum]|uniref:ATP-binding protein n=1 Tax=Plebeiibacterium sediminum TaxID=2992112 RepID=A0AAE3M9F6_9BACT|nr:ATP-binding protein [Plebeiobacterium sediminum]MCW3789372.1 ATP-binding protein [Plebeiobacterium sediminum]